MKTALATLALCLGGVSTASADPHFYNATEHDYTVEATFPNGKVETRKSAGNQTGLTAEYFNFAPTVKSVKVRVLDESGAVAWKGVAKTAECFVIIPDPKGVKAVFAGIYGVTPPQTTVFMNITGEPLKLDLEGANGVGASRGIVPGKAFDVKKATKLDPKESSYEVSVKNTKTNDVTKADEKLTPGNFELVWRNANAELKVSSICAIATKK